MNFGKFIPWIIIAVVILWIVGLYNGLISSRENVNSKWANVEAQYQRRADLIPNLVSTVKGAADFEKSTIEAVRPVIHARPFLSSAIASPKSPLAPPRNVE